MGVLLRVENKKAILRDGHWVSANPELEEELNRMTEDWIQQTGGPPLGSRDPESVTAKEVARRTGGRILLHTPANARSASRHYFSRRQMKLAFSADRGR